jgi:PAS domain S-box-containing protein
MSFPEKIKYELSLVFLDGTRDSFKKGMDLIRTESKSSHLFYFRNFSGEKYQQSAELFWVSSENPQRNSSSYFPEIFDYTDKFIKVSDELFKTKLVVKDKSDNICPKFLEFIKIDDFSKISFISCFSGDIFKGFMVSVSDSCQSDLSFLSSVSELVAKSAEYTNSFFHVKSGESKYRAILENIEDGYFEIDLKGNLRAFNDSVCRIACVSRAELKGINNREYTTSETARNMYRVFSEIYKTGIPLKLRDYEVILKNNEKKWIELSASLIKNDSGEPVGFRGLVRDVTARKKSEYERKKLEEKLSQAQRLEAVGTLAGGIAHDFNNLLMAVQGNASLIISASRGNSVVAEKAANIEKCVESGANLIKQLLGFARGGKYLARPCSLNRIIDASVVMLSRAHKNIVIERQFNEELFPVEADQSQLEQVFMNLYLNAVYAMDKRGILKIKTENVLISDETASVHELSGGDYAVVEVSDTGMGMKPEIMKRIFEPFFTTREKGRGTGLGLASVFGIVKNHGGFISVSSVEGRGSSFKLHFPAFKSELDEKRENKEKTAGPKKQKTILIADDDEAILDVCSEMLVEAGYNVKTVSGGYEAVNLFQQKTDEIDLVILDILMPDLDGFETYKKLKKIDTNVCVLFSSGYIEEEQYKKEEFGKKMKDAFIAKPYNLSSLTEKIESLFKKI